MGILDNKSRVLDTVITGEGRRQLAMGNFNPAFATVSDRHTYYEKSEASGSEDASDRIYFEASPDNMTDYITFETDDSGRLLGYPIHEGHYWEGRVGTVEAFGVGELGEPKYKVIGTEGFASQAIAIITSSIENFKDLQTIGTRDATELKSLKTKLSLNNYNFLLDNSYPFSEGSSDSIVDLDSMEVLFFDDRVSDAINFKFLPPIVKDTVGISIIDTYWGDALTLNTGDTVPPDIVAAYFNDPANQHSIELTLATPMGYLTEGYRYLAAYTDIRHRILPEDVEIRDRPETPSMETKHLTFNKLMDHLGYTHTVHADEDPVSGGLNTTYNQLTADSRESIEINFETTSTTNNIIMQMFEVVPELGTLVKLDTIQFSDLEMEKDRDLFFAGKLYFNNSGMPVYGNLFDIVVD